MPRKRVILLWLFACESGPHCASPIFFSWNREIYCAEHSFPTLHEGKLAPLTADFSFKIKARREMKNNDRSISMCTHATFPQSFLTCY